MLPAIKNLRAVTHERRWVIPGEGGEDPDPPGDEFTRWPHVLPFYRREIPVTGLSVWCPLEGSARPLTDFSRMHGYWSGNITNPENECRYDEFPSGVGIARIIFDGATTISPRRIPGATCYSYSWNDDRTLNYDPAPPGVGLLGLSQSRFLPYPIVMGAKVGVPSQFIPLGVITGFPQWPSAITVTISGAAMCPGTPNASLISSHINGSYVCRLAYGIGNRGYVPFWWSELEVRRFHWAYWISPGPHAPADPSSSLSVEVTWRGENGVTGPSSTWSILTVLYRGMVDGGTSVSWGCDGPAERRAYLQNSHTLEGHTFTPNVCAGEATITPIY